MYCERLVDDERGRAFGVALAAVTLGSAVAAFGALPGAALHAVEPSTTDEFLTVTDEIVITRVVFPRHNALGEVARGSPQSEGGVT